MNGRDLGLLVLRVGLGIVMIVHGSMKAFGWLDGPGLQGWLGYMQSIGVPAPLAWLAMLTELAGGFGVLLGVFARIAALGFAATMIVAIMTVHWSVGFLMNWGSVAGRGEGWEFSFALLTVSIALVLTGPGRYSLVDRER